MHGYTNLLKGKYRALKQNHSSNAVRTNCRHVDAKTQKAIPGAVQMIPRRPTAFWLLL